MKARGVPYQFREILPLTSDGAVGDTAENPTYCTELKRNWCGMNSVIITRLYDSHNFGILI